MKSGRWFWAPHTAGTVWCLRETLAWEPEGQQSTTTGQQAVTCNSEQRRHVKLSGKIEPLWIHGIRIPSLAEKCSIMFLSSGI